MIVTENMHEENNMNLINNLESSESDQKKELDDPNKKNGADQVQNDDDNKSTVEDQSIFHDSSNDSINGDSTLLSQPEINNVSSTASRDILESTEQDSTNSGSALDKEPIIENGEENKLTSFSTSESEKNNSDSEESNINPELQKCPNDVSDLESDNEFTNNKRDKSKKRFLLDDSDSENEQMPCEEPNKVSETEQMENDVSQDILESTSTKKKKHKRLALVDSDSESEVENITEADIYTTNNKGELILESTEQENITEKKLSALCDSESSDEDVNNIEIIEDTQNSNSDEDETVIPQSYKKKTKKGEKPPKKMTGKEASVLKKEIKSESQRMVREMNVSLPYHRPKQFTIKEFLSRRPRLSSVVPLPSQISAPLAIHMATEQLDIISQKLKERQKQIEEFYKSESEESEDENDKDYVPPLETLDENKDLSDPVKENPESKLTDQENDSRENDSQENDSQENGSQENDSQENDSQENDSQENYSQENDSQENDSQENEVKDSGDSGIVSDETEKITDDEKRLNTEVHSDGNEHSKVCTDSGIINSENICNDSEIIRNNENEENSNLNREDDSAEQLKDSTVMNKDSETENTEFFELYLENSEDPSAQQQNEQPVPMETDLDNTTEKNNSSTTFEFGELDKEIEAYGSKPEDPKESKLSKIELLRQKLANIKPRLSGNPNEVIDLETGTTQPDEITKLKERFIQQQTLQKSSHKSKVMLNIVSVERGEIHKETVAVNVDEDESKEIEEKPGVRLRRLRNELQNQITQKRLEFWQNKTLKSKDEEIQESEDNTKADYEAGEDILDDDDEEEVSESSEEEDIEEEIEEENEVKKKCAFADDEAEESDREDDMEELRINDNEDEEEVDDENEEETENAQCDTVDDVNKEFCSDDEKAMEETVRKPLKRILKGFTEDSDSDDDEITAKVSNSPKDVVENNKDDKVDDKITPNQEQHDHTPVKCNTAVPQKSFEFLTPISYITGLQNLSNSAAKNRKNSPIASVFRMPSVPSPLKETNWQSTLQKKLFTDSEITNSQLQDMADLCSTNFTESQVLEEQEIENSENCTQVSDSEMIMPSGLPTTQDLVDVCSGTFEDTPPAGDQAESSQVLAGSALPTTQDLLNVCSGSFTGISSVDNSSKSNVERHTLNQTSEVKSLDMDQDIISQLIDEEEMEKFKKKFESPFLTDTQKRIVDEFQEREAAGGGIIDSEDEDEVLGIKKKKSNRKKLKFSDDESSEEEDQEEEIGLHDEDEDVDDEDNDVPVDNIGYDSEENEVELEDDNPMKKKLKASDFFEKEAELSESEWGSADEDEKDLDDLEFELGDEDQFDQKKLRTDLEKIHMRRMLDDDQREVKLLQELLLEDGELHGTGRERQFRWKNIDSQDNDDGTAKNEDDDVYLDEDESEEQWRRKRYEREMFLKEQQQKSQIIDEDDDLLSDSPLLKIGHQIIQKSNSNSQQKSPVEKSKDDDIQPVHKSCFSIFNKRGSFLSRGEATLQRLARFNNITTTTTTTTEIGGTAKNSRKFLFQTVSIEQTVLKEKKRKADGGTPNVIKKLRLTENFSPANKKKKSSKPSAKTKLFDVA